MISRFGEILLITLAAMFAFLAGWTLAPGVPESAGVIPLVGRESSALKALGPVGETVLGYRAGLASRWEQTLTAWCPPEAGEPKAAESEEPGSRPAPMGQGLKQALCRLAR